LETTGVRSDNKLSVWPHALEEQQREGSEGDAGLECRSGGPTKGSQGGMDSFARSSRLLSSIVQANLVESKETVYLLLKVDKESGTT